jgi:hypothetical protein
MKETRRTATTIRPTKQQRVIKKKAQFGGVKTSYWNAPTLSNDA